jgi:predicted homoserine dehydrogenase-like protein
VAGPIRIGIIGTGFIGRGLYFLLQQLPGIVVTKILTRTDRAARADIGPGKTLTNSLEELIDGSDIVVECTGDVVYATDAINEAMNASLPVITMDAELQVTTGSYFSGKGLITEAEGDQPGCMAALREECLSMGFKPVVYGNIKGFLNICPQPDEMALWAQKSGISIDKTVSFTDGTKVQIEQALIANAFGAGIACPGLAGYPAKDVYSGALALADVATKLDYTISDYILSPGSPAGIFIVARHDERFREYLKYFKMGEGPYYTLLRNYHLCNLEIPKTIGRIANGGGVLLNNGEKPSISVAAIAKKSLAPGDFIRRGTGSFEVRGSTVKISDCPGHVPIGLLSDAVVTRHISPGQMLEFDDVLIGESLARDAWEKTARSGRHRAYY